MKMTAALRRLVSQNRRRYNEDGFDLDLTYILPNLIAMGFPAENYEKFFRNNISEVSRFFEAKHPGHYRIYNLCSERNYNTAHFRHHVVVYPFDDHHPPCIDLIQSCCEDIEKWLASDPRNVAAIHCKAGKGRTGLMICSYLLHSGHVSSVDEALSFYGSKRTVDSRGVTIPSQRRYIQYYANLLKSGSPYRDITLNLARIRMLHPPSSEDIPCSGLIFSIILQKKILWTSEIFPLADTSDPSQPGELALPFRPVLPVWGDVLFVCYGVQAGGLSIFHRKEEIFHFWFNTFFVGSDVDPGQTGSTQTGLCITRDRLDMTVKDKTWRNFPLDFRIILWFQEQTSLES